MVKVNDRIKQGSNTSGSGTLSLNISYSASGFQDFSKLGNGSKTYYAIEEAPSGWEVGIGTYNTGTLSRDTVLDSSAAGAKINLGGSGLVFVTYPADKSVFGDENNNVSVTGLIIGASGIAFGDGSTQTTAFTGTSSFATQVYVDSVSGDLQGKIGTNDTDISNLSGLVSTNTSSISTNSTDISTVSGIAASKDNYQYWTITDGANSENISSTNQVKFTGAGSASVSYGTSNNTVTISGTAGSSYTAGTGLTLVGTEFNTAGTGVFDAIGVGTESPTYELDVAGDIGVDEYIYHNDDGGTTNTYIRFREDTVNFVAGGWSAIKLEKSTGKIQLNNSNQDLDVQMMSTGGAVILHTDADLGYVGIGTISPAYPLHVSGNAGFDEYLYHNGNDDTAMRFQSGVMDLRAGTGGTSWSMVKVDQVNGKVTINNSSHDVDFRVNSDDGTQLIRTDAANNRVGIGTGTPAYTLDVVGTGNFIGVRFPDGNVQTIAYTGGAGGAGAGYDFNVSDGDTTETISSGNTVLWTGVGHTTVDYISGTNTFQISGADQDLSSYATQAYVTGASGNLQGQISTNDTDISNLSGLVSTNTSNISANDTDISNLSGLVSTNTSNISTNNTDIDTVSGLTLANANGISAASGTLQSQITSNDSELTTISGLTVNNSTDIANTSGSLYSYWTISDGATSENVTKTGQVYFTGAGNTTVSYSSASNTVTVSGTAGGAGGYDWTVADENGNSETISSGNTVYFSGVGTTDVTYSASTNTVAISGGGGGSSYTAGTGLTLVGTEFNVTGIETSLLSANSVTVTAGTGLTNGGSVSLGSSVTVDSITASTSAAGVVQLQDSVTNSTTDKAVTPNAVYDMSGVLLRNAGSGLDLNTSDLDVKLDNTTVEFNSDVIRVKDGGITNAKLDNSSVTVTAGTGLGNGGAVSLGSSVTVDVTGIETSLLSSSSVTVTAGTGLTNGGSVALGSSVTVDAKTGSTSAAGVVQLQDSVTDSTTDRAVTPNAVYDMSGVINGNINTYTAGSGLNLDGSEFDIKLDNSTVEFSSDIVQVKDGGISNAKLANDSLTVTAGSGLSNGGEIDLGSSKTIDITPGGVSNAMLANSSVTITAGTGLTNGGSSSLGSSVTVDAITGSTSVAGVVQLQDAVTNGTTNRAVTPNAVYDMSGVLVRNAGSGIALNTNDLDIKLDNSTVEFNSDVIRVKDGGITNTKLDNSAVTVTAGTGLTNGGSVALGASVTVDAISATTSAAGVVQLQDSVTDSTTNKAVTPNAVYDMSGVINGNINTYTAGSGLNLDGSEFDIKLDNATLEFNSDIVRIKDGGVSNAKLANDSVTITAGSGLSNGGEVDLGATKVIDITPGGVTNAMLAGSISESKLASDVNLDAVTDNGATTTNGINVGMVDTSGVRSAMQSGAGSSPGDTRNLDLSQASTFHHSMNQGLNNITLSNVTAGQKFLVRLTQNASATGTAGWFSTIRWAEGGSAPTLTTTTSKTDVFGFLCVTSGSYDGFVIGQNI
jgi:hypothetical protein